MTQFPKDHALLVIDIQNDFCPKGRLAVAQGDEIIPLANRLMPLFATIIATQDWHPSHHQSFASQYEDKAPFEMVDMAYGSQILWPDHCVIGSEGADFHPDLMSDYFHAIIRKGSNPDLDSYSGFFENDHQTPTGLEGLLRGKGITEVYIIGLATDFCVKYTALDAIKCGFNTKVIMDACRAIDLDNSLMKTKEEFALNGIEMVNSNAL